MIFYFDTSSLVKLFHQEKGSQHVERIIKSENNEIWVSELAQVEFLSALFRRFRNKELTDEQLKMAIVGFQEQLTFFNVEPLGQAIIKEAEVLLKQYGGKKRLRTLDSLQIATFILIAEKSWIFVASDDVLCEIIAEMHFKTLNPLKEE